MTIMRKHQSLNQTTLWKIVKEFFLSYSLFDRVFKDYHIRLERFRKEYFEKGREFTPSPQEICSLFEFRKLDRLRNTHLFALKGYAHEMFRATEKHVKFDLFVSEIFHEISILKEFEYNLEHYILRHKDDDMLVSEELQESQKVFELKVRRATQLFEKSLEQLHEILYKMRFDKILIRSLYFADKHLFPDVYSGGLNDVLKKMHKKNTSAAGYYMMAINFCCGGFFTQARLALRRAYKNIDTKEKELKKRLDALNTFFQEQKLIPQGKSAMLVNFTKWTDNKSFEEIVKDVS